MHDTTISPTRYLKRTSDHCRLRLQEPVNHPPEQSLHAGGRTGRIIGLAEAVIDALQALGGYVAAFGTKFGHQHVVARRRLVLVLCALGQVDLGLRPSQFLGHAACAKR